MEYIGSIDFCDGDFKLHAFDSDDIISADIIFRRYVIKKYESRINEINKITVFDTRYITKAICEYF